MQHIIKHHQLMAYLQGLRPRLFMAATYLKAVKDKETAANDELRFKSFMQLSSLQGSMLSALPELPFDQSIKDDIVNSVNQNLSIIIPSQELPYENWTGIGFIKENQDTGESGWMLSGMIAGGMTVWSDDRWPQYYYDRLVNPYSEPANYDPASAKFIHKIKDFSGSPI